MPSHLDFDEESNPDLSMPDEPEFEPMLRGAGKSIVQSSHTSRVKAYQGMQTPYFLADMLAHEDPSIALRIFLLDNSGSTSNADGHVLEKTSLGHLHAAPSTRWEEISEMALDQARWNAKGGVQSEFLLLNPPCPQHPQEGRDFVVVNPKAGDADAQVRVLRNMLRQNGPRGTTPLTLRLQQLHRRLQQEMKDGRRIMLSIVTDGVPTAPNGSGNLDRDKHDFVNQLRAFTASFNAFVVIRLATDDDEVVNYYNRIDEELELPMDVLDDLRGEAEEVYTCGNGWFAYTPLIHRIREGGTLEKLFDLLDERALKASEISKLMELLFRGRDDAPFPRSPAELLKLGKEINSKAEHVYDARLDRLAPPLNIKLLERALGLSSFQRLKAAPLKLMQRLACAKIMPRD
eukprot:CAMPEP_0197657716 /NCGR_PEP_ID=MMETSP1338-20131121/44803_1 /TAXON_ID=43686 ORGANISM="Pelagodinium beii, Strain RCC1491" /NCGR_SAMPLE_ID=MMETSP1338 /ASSEMBLY_ACC=CAM_ASM_000754 /LENGTH=402 /DNA_ID=CAMNT_0043234153 /DNA_START=118 /DNA_END=1326 /DNA_ORIENTATION=+